MEIASRLLMDPTGTALVEALVAAPVIALILAGILAFNGMYGAKLEAKARARRMAWLQADSGECPERACVGEECRAIETDLHAAGLGDLASVRSGKFSLASFLGSAREFLIGRITRGIGSASASTPELVSSGRTIQRGVASLLCNTTARRIDSGVSVLEHACSSGLSTTEYASEICE